MRGVWGECGGLRWQPGCQHDVAGVRMVEVESELDRGGDERGSRLGELQPYAPLLLLPPDLSINDELEELWSYSMDVY